MGLTKGGILPKSTLSDDEPAKHIGLVHGLRKSAPGGRLLLVAPNGRFASAAGMGCDEEATLGVDYSAATSNFVASFPHEVQPGRDCRANSSRYGPATNFSIRS